MNVNLYEAVDAFKEVIENHPGPVLLTHVDTTIVFGNRAAERWLELSFSDLVGTRFDALLSEAERAAIGRAISDVAVKQTPPCIRQSFARSGGQFTIEWSVIPIRDDTGELVELGFIGHDVSLYTRHVPVNHKEVSHEGIPIVVFCADRAGLWTSVNQEAVRLLGAASSDLLGKGWLTVVHPEDRTKVSIEFKRAVKSGVRHSVDFRLKTPQGRLIWACLTVNPIEKSGENGNACIGVIEDRTASRIREQRYCSSAERLEYATELTGLGLWDWDNTTGEVFYSAEMEKMLGYEPGTIPPDFSSFERAVHPADAKSFDTAVEEVLSGIRDTLYADIRVVTSSGKELWTVIKGQVLKRDIDRSAQRIVGTLQDVSRIHTTGEEKRHLAEVLEAFPEMILITDSDGRISYSNPVARAVLGSVVQGGGTRQIEEIFPVDQRKDFVENFLSRAAIQGSVRGEAEVLTPQHTIMPVGLVLVAHAGTDGRLSHISMMLRDISMEREQARMLEQAKVRAEESNTFRAELLANLSHEIRTPMTGVLGMTDILLQGGCGEEQRDYLHTIRESAESLLTVMNDIVDYARAESGELQIVPEWFSLSEMAEGLRKLFQVRFKEKGVRFSQKLGSDVPDVICADQNRMRQMLINLIANATSFVSREGTVELGVNLESRVGKHAVITISVWNEGHEISSDQIRRMEEAFIEGKTLDWRQLGGVSVGIGISAKLIRMMDGDIRVENRVGGGCTFSATLPVTIGGHKDLEAFHRSRASSDAGPAGGSASCKILLVEDNPVNQKLARLMLERLGHSVVLAEDGDIGVEKFSSENFDLVLMDVQMPRVDGFQATHQIRSVESKRGGPTTPIVAMTAQALEGDRERCLEAGMDDYISKPIDRTELARLVTAVRERKGRQS